MDSVQRIQAILHAADRSLTELASDYFKARDFDGATACIEVARKLSSLLSPAGRGPIDQNVQSPEVAASTDPVATFSRRQASALSSPITARFSRVRKGEYPKFVREGDSLIKIGWSKSDKAEYEHKSTKKVLSLLVPSIAKSGASGKKFSMEKLLPLKDEDGGEVPGYQAYLCLAWLRTTGLVQQHGRQGYTISKKVDFPNSVETAWENLPNR
jgi:hypothetical protein